ncbi:hypothetical protein EVAR_4629_1 [Eumeta japonica]|uniref:Uncharacterized protein n=1 Tax=Eumeta variegata TaxID=151549 RepID=A0A4C1SWF2_EUMVA|nr:hypothetical protein EVAR_4629_1 [Eumeta japonica]
MHVDNSTYGHRCPWILATLEKSPVRGRPLRSGKRPRESLQSKWSPLLIDTHNPKRATSALPASWLGIGYLERRELVHRSGRGTEEKQGPPAGNLEGAHTKIPQKSPIA